MRSISTVFNKQIRLFNRKKNPSITQNTVIENNVAETPLSSNLNDGVLGVGAQSLVKDVSVLESYMLNAPYASVQVTRDMVRGNINYAVEEPKLSNIDLANLHRLKGILNEVLQYRPKELKSKQAAGEYLVKNAMKYWMITILT